MKAESFKIWFFVLLSSMVLIPVSCHNHRNKHAITNGSDDSDTSHIVMAIDTNVVEHPIRVHFVYDVAKHGFAISGTFYPFNEESETGQIEIVFTPVNSGQTLTFSNVGLFEEGHPEWPQKFTGKNIYEYVFNDKFDSFHEGDTLHWHYHTVQPEWIDSPLLYNAEFQFYDIDFDGKDEFLVNDFSQGKYGNNYTVYEITSNGFALKKGTPFETITNRTKFYPSERKIVDYLYDDTDALYGYIISADGNRVIKSVKLNKSNQ